ncbi:proline iminopeptidase [Naviculisporaceae sp. PSN 640]
MAAIKPARLISQRAHLIPGQLHVTEHFFEVPKNYFRPELGSLKLFGRSVRKHEKPIVPLSRAEQEMASRIPYMVYLEGGPGYGNREPQESPITGHMLNRGYQVLFLDYRGTGLSTPLNARHLREQGTPQEQAEYLKLLRADNNVRDLEAVRLCLTAEFPEERKKWSLFGQSFGGFVALSYLSKYPKGLREVFMTGGLAPIKSTPEEVYRATYKKVIERNQAYYKKYPEDVDSVKKIIEFITQQEQKRIPLPAGGFLTVTRLLSLGLSFGAHGGLDAVHAIILRLVTDLDQFGYFTRASLALVEDNISFDSNPIYAILHEPIYCFKKGVASRWAAWRVGKEIKNFAWLAPEEKQTSPPSYSGGADNGNGSGAESDEVINAPYFSGEMVFPEHFDSYPELREMKEAANILAECDDWDELYDEDQLRDNEVPVYAASYIDDMYVDFDLAEETANLVKGCQVFETNRMYHNAVRARTDEVIGQLFKMRDDSID